MATAAVLPFVSVDEYLHSAYSPDVDYVDGTIEERNLGENDHSNLQTELSTILRVNRQAWRIKTFVEQRVQTSKTRFRVPDVCVMEETWKKTPIIHDAPLLCLEVLSPKDRFARVLQRCREFIAMGVRAVWIFDPEERTVNILHQDGKLSEHREGVLRLEGTAIEISLDSLFAVLDEE